MSSVIESSEQLVRYHWMIARDVVPILQMGNVEAREFDSHGYSAGQ